MPAAFRLGLVGLGSMGANHARIIMASPRCSLARIIDSDPSVATRVVKFPGTKLRSSLDDLGELDAAIVASTTGSHFGIAKTLIELGIPTLVEKPMATKLDEVSALVRLSHDHDVPIMCGFVERFNPVVASSSELLDGPILHIRTQRQSPASARHSANAIWDLLLHDLDLVLGYVPGSKPERLAAVAGTAPGGSTLEAVEAAFHLGGALVETMCSRLWQRKVRSIQIATESSLLELDLLRQTITTYHNISQEQVSEGALIYRSATTVDVPFVRHAGEPLALELDHFLDLVSGKVDAEAERASIVPPHQLAEVIQQQCQ